MADLVSVAKEVIVIIDKVKDNVKESHRLREYISALVNVWHKVPTSETSEVFNLVADVIESARDLMSQFTTDNLDKLDKVMRFLARVVHRESDAKEFALIFAKCERALLLLNVELQLTLEERRRLDQEAIMQGIAARQSELLDTQVEANNYKALFSLGMKELQRQNEDMKRLSTLPDSQRLPADPTPPLVAACDLSGVDATNVEELGRGSFGRVVVGRWKGTRVAVKQLFGAADTFHFDREVSVHARANHPNVLPLRGVVKEPGKLWMLLDVAEEGSLYSLIHERKADFAAITELQRVRLVIGVVAGLRYLHEEIGVVHRDLKSHNILLLDASRRPMVADFGLSRIKSLSTSGMTQATGTARWAPPEENRSSFASDVWAVAMVIYEVVAGRLPYDDCRNDRDLIRAIEIQDRRPDLAGVAEGWRALLEGMWATEKASRTPLWRVSEVLEGMEDALTGRGPSKPSMAPAGQLEDSASGIKAPPPRGGAIADDSAQGGWRTRVEPAAMSALQQAGVSPAAVDRMVEEWGFFRLDDLREVTANMVDGLGLKMLEAKRLKEVAGQHTQAAAVASRGGQGQGAGDGGSGAAAPPPKPTPAPPTRPAPEPTGNAKLDEAVRNLLDPSWTGTKIDLVRNNIGDDGAKAIAEGLKVNGSLTSLDLDCNKIGAEGAKAIGEALKVNGSLTALDLRNNNIGDEGGKAIGEALKVNGSLTSLELYYNGFGDDGAKAIAEALKVNGSLTSLYLSRNNIGDEGGKAIGEALKVNGSLTSLNLEDNNIATSDLKKAWTAGGKRDLDNIRF